jgi:hypothetical protein
MGNLSVVPMVDPNTVTASGPNQSTGIYEDGREVFIFQGFSYLLGRDECLFASVIDE